MVKIRFLLVVPSSDKPTPLFAFLSFSGKRVKVYSGRSIHPKQWDQSEQKALTKGYPRNGPLNDWLELLKERLTTCYDTHTATGTLPTTEELRALALPEDTEAAAPDPVTAPAPARPDLLTTFSNWIENRGLTQSPNTVRTYRTCLRHLRDMQRIERYAIDFDTMSHGFGEKFARYLLTKRNLIDSVINKNLFRIKHFLVWAQENGYPVVVEPKQFRWQHQEPEILTLTRAEV